MKRSDLAVIGISHTQGRVSLELSQSYGNETFIPEWNIYFDCSCARNQV